MKLRTKLMLEVLTNPSLWLRIYRIDKAFDRWLWDALERDCEVSPVTNPLSDVLYTVRIDGLAIWVGNEPYADGGIKVDGDDVLSSRVTALRLRKIVSKLWAKGKRRGFVPPAAVGEGK